MMTPRQDDPGKKARMKVWMIEMTELRILVAVFIIWFHWIPVAAMPASGSIVEICRVFSEEPRIHEADWMDTCPQFLVAHPQTVGLVVQTLEPALDELLRQPLPSLEAAADLTPKPRLNSWRAAMIALSGLGMHLAGNRNWPEASACLRSSLKIAVALTRSDSGDTSGMLQQMVAFGGLNATLRAIHRVIQQWTETPEQVMDLVHATEQAWQLKAPYSFALNQEYRSTLGLIRSLTRDATILDSPEPFSSSTVERAIQYFEPDVREYFSRAEELSHHPWYRNREKWNRHSGDLREFQNGMEVSRFSAWWNPAWALSRRLIRAFILDFERAFRQHVRTDSLLAGTAVAGSARIHFLEHGKWPESLSQVKAVITTHLPTDPCTGKPWVWKLRNNQPLLYSVGWNGLDEEGADEDADPDDFIIFTVRESGR